MSRARVTIRDEVLLDLEELAEKTGWERADVVAVAVDLLRRTPRKHWPQARQPRNAAQTRSLVIEALQRFRDAGFPWATIADVDAELKKRPPSEHRHRDTIGPVLHDLEAEGLVKSREDGRRGGGLKWRLVGRVKKTT